jgi:hypothetical protein
MMTPEERYTRLENLVQSTIEVQAHLSARQEKTTDPDRSRQRRHPGFDER